MMPGKLSLTGWVVIIILMVLILLMQITTPAEAAPLLQATSTPTPTPDVSYYHEMSSGNAVRVDRVVTYGQIWIIGAVLAAALPLVLLLIFRIVTHYLR